MNNPSKSGLQPVKKQLAYRLFYPQVPTVLCAKHGRTVAAMPANSCVPLSDSPALIGVAVRIGSNTEKVLTRTLSFSLSWLDYSERSRKMIADLSSKGRQGTDKLKASGIQYESIGGVPVLKEAKAFIVCRKMSAEQYGDHVLFVGIIQAVRASSDFTEDEYWRFETYKPMLYLGSNRKQPFATL